MTRTKITCLRCPKKFFSADVRSNRHCPKCQNFLDKNRPGIRTLFSPDGGRQNERSRE